eukprot:TRINITY_DN289_c0_g1_i1.p1 TRINITY_DN289_c0_g1~~TRINITY_DN289_c0_g1_i1.p1  ORF type:complete len:502 (+),score=62.19 TRINITY_DN289_c0_g1_i1:101-1507(+)
MGEVASCSSVVEGCALPQNDAFGRLLPADINTTEGGDRLAWLDDNGVVMKGSHDFLSAGTQSVGKPSDQVGAHGAVCMAAPLSRMSDCMLEEHCFKEATDSDRQVDTLPRGPVRSSVPTFLTAERSEFSGQIRSGEVAYLALGEKIQRMWLSIYRDGFTVTPSFGSTDPGGQQRKARAWSPFTVTEMCQVQTKRQEQELSVFKLTILKKDDSDLFFYFGCCGPNAVEERAKWLHDIKEAIGNVTLSIIPTHSIVVSPVPGAPGTVTRLMAGYLMHLLGSDRVAVFYCELQAYTEESAKIAMYPDEWCEHEVDSVPISAMSSVSTRKGDSCTVLGVDSHLMCARTWRDKELWLRAISNVKVKLMFDAPSPTEEELEVYRSAVLERLQETEDTPRANAIQADAPLLERVYSRPSRPMPAGDVLEPEPMCSPRDSPEHMHGFDFVWKLDNMEQVNIFADRAASDDVATTRM